MNKRIINFLMVLVCCGAITGACKKEDNGVPYTYTSQVTVGTNGSLDGANTATTNASKYQIVLKFSTDNGASWTEYPKLKPGQSYLAKLFHGALGEDLVTYVDPHAYSYDPGTAMEFDWSSSVPAPNGGSTGQSAEFTLTGKNFVGVKVTDHHCPTDLTIFADKSGWIGSEGTYTKITGSGTTTTGAGSDDLAQFTIDPTLPNRLWATNIFGDGQDVTAYMDFATSTSYTDQTVTIPTQTTSEGGVYSGSGYYDQCRQKLVVNVSYKFGSTTYKWTYNYVKGPQCDYDASSWAGAWVGAEGPLYKNTTLLGNGSNDKMNITKDPTVANKFWADNFFGDNDPTVPLVVSVYFTLQPSTTHDYWSQIVTMPAQTTSEGGSVAASTGMYDQCSGTFWLPCAYTFGTTTYYWTYSFTKDQ